MIVCGGVESAIIFGMILPFTLAMLMLVGWYFGPYAFMVSIPFGVGWLYYKSSRLLPLDDEND